MKNFKNFLTVALMATCVAAPVSAQVVDSRDCKTYPHMFVGLQGGAQTTLTNYDMTKLITPTASVSFGAMFTPIIGARLHVNGYWNKGGVKGRDMLIKSTTQERVYVDVTQNNGQILPGQTPDNPNVVELFEDEQGRLYMLQDKTVTETVAGESKTYEYKYITTNLDLMVNLCTLFGRKDYYPVNAYLIGGIGLNTAWSNADALAMKNTMPFAWDGTRFSHNARVGAMLDVNLHKNVSLNLEVAANSLSDRYNSKISGTDDWQITAQLGLAFKFGYKKKPAPKPEVWETVIDTTWYDDVTYVDDYKDRKIDKRIFFAIRESDVESTDAQIAAVAEFLKGVKNAEITITSYADKGTGNPKLNMEYSKQRAEKTRQALINKGVDPSIIKNVEWKGDTVQPYPEDNDKNRVSIITGHGVYSDPQKVVNKKFRTTERRVRVQ
ncbi:MAG: OmpA family protein [Bacteroidales bacterium]|nr:OmpA family protein [Candidatus Physcousia equi]